MANIRRRPAAFNLDDPFERKLDRHASKHTNFSAYVKRLIQRDMEGGSGPAEKPDRESTGLDKRVTKELLGDFLKGAK